MGNNTTEKQTEQKKNTRLSDFRKEVENKVSNGYTCLGISIAPVTTIPLTRKSDKRSAIAGEGSKMPGGREARASFGMFDSKQSNPIPVDNAGSEGLGYIPWGANNDLPNQIYNLAANQPYTAEALKFLVELTVGNGPRLMYKWARYSGGSISEEYTPYEHAGVLIRNRIQELNTKVENRNNPDRRGEERADGEYNKESSFSSDIINWNEVTNPSVKSEKNNPENEPGTLEYEIKLLKEDYQKWQDTLPQYEKFIEDNNLMLHFLECMTDYWHMDMYIPTVGFNIGRSAGWEPKVLYVGRIPNVCGRLEQMDDNLRINHVYYSERWRKDATAKLKNKEIVAYPAVQNKSILKGLRTIVNKSKRARVKDRPRFVATPIRYISSNPYYPRPAWWSIFSSMVYNYANTLIIDKAIARENATMWSKIIFIDQEYLSRIFDLKGADTPQKQEEIRNEIYDRVNKLLQQKENNGKTLLMDKYLGPDGKTVQYSIEIVEVPQPSSGAETKDELEEISSIIFFAFGVHPALIGAIPGKSGSSGGTYQRELILIKQNLLNPARSLYLNFLQSIVSFNEWDTHAVWKISDLVLTTLDRSKTGTEEVVN